MEGAWKAARAAPTRARRSRLETDPFRFRKTNRPESHAPLPFRRLRRPMQKVPPLLSRPRPDGIDDPRPGDPLHILWTGSSGAPGPTGSSGPGTPPRSSSASRYIRNAFSGPGLLPKRALQAPTSGCRSHRGWRVRDAGQPEAAARSSGSGHPAAGPIGGPKSSVFPGVRATHEEVPLLPHPDLRSNLRNIP